MREDQGEGGRWVREDRGEVRATGEDGPLSGKFLNEALHVHNLSLSL